MSFTERRHQKVFRGPGTEPAGADETLARGRTRWTAIRVLRMVSAFVLAVIAVAFPANMAGAVIGGSNDGSAHPYVGFVLSQYDGYDEYCTGSAISATVVITAAHCVDGAKQTFFLYDADGSGFSSPPGGGIDGAIRATAHVYPGYCSPCGTGLKRYDINDLAVLVLDQPISLPRYAQLPAVGQVDTLKNPEVRYVGYGVIGYAAGGGKPQQIFDDNLVRRTAAGQIVTNNSVISKNYILLSHAAGIRVCNGDSGSPILLGDTVLGVLSFINGQCTGNANAFRIDSPEVLSFIRSFL